MLWHYKAFNLYPYDKVVTEISEKQQFLLAAAVYLRESYTVPYYKGTELLQSQITNIVRGHLLLMYKALCYVYLIRAIDLQWDVKKGQMVVVNWSLLILWVIMHKYLSWKKVWFIHLNNFTNDLKIWTKKLNKNISDLLKSLRL